VEAGEHARHTEQVGWLGVGVGGNERDAVELHLAPELGHTRERRRHHLVIGGEPGLLMRNVHRTQLRLNDESSERAFLLIHVVGLIHEEPDEMGEATREVDRMFHAAGGRPP